MLTSKGYEKRPSIILNLQTRGLNSEQNNVLITDEGRAALCDFGLSQVVEDLGRPTGFTLSNPDVGPIRWQAPEFLDGEDEAATLMSDVWSFGCTAFEVNIFI
jgi:serine/threonine protein kinase